MCFVIVMWFLWLMNVVVLVLLCVLVFNVFVWFNMWIGMFL